MSDFPTSIDNLTRVNATDTMVAVPHHTLHNDQSDAIEAIEGRIGVTGSTDPNTVTGKLHELDTRTGITVDQILNLTDDGFVKTTAGDGTLYVDTNTYLTANQSISLSGDVTGSGSTSISTTITNNSVGNGKLAQLSTNRIKGRVTAGTGNVEDLTGTQVTSLLDVFTTSSKGLVPSPTTSTGLFLKDDGTWATPFTNAGTVTSFSFTNANGFSGSVVNGTSTPTLTLGTSISGIVKGNGTSLSAAAAGSDYEVPISAGTGLTRTTNTFSVNSSQNISTLSNLTTNGFVKTSGGTGALSVSTLSLSDVPAANDQVLFGASSVLSQSAGLTFNPTGNLFTNRPFVQTITGNYFGNSLGSIVNGADLLEQNAHGMLRINYYTATAVFQTAASGTVSGADTGGYTDITDSYNTGFVNITNGGASLKRFYIGYYEGTPTSMCAYSSGTGGTNGTVGTIIWERWNGTAWASFTGSNLTADATFNVTASTARSTINGVSAYWIRGTVNTGYTVAPVFRFGVFGGFQNSSPQDLKSGIFIGKANLPASTIASMTNPGVISVVVPGNGSQAILNAYSEQTGSSLFSIGGDGAISAGSADNTFRNLTLNGGASNQNAVLTLTTGSKSQASWLTSGVFFRSLAGTRTNSSAAGTYATAVFNSFNTPTLAATNASTITTDAANVYIENAPVQGTNQTLTNTWALWVDAGASRFDGNVFMNAANIYTDTTTGLKIGTATTQKIGFFNATPVVQQTGNALTALSTLGLVASPTLTKTDVGLANVDNTSDATKNSSAVTLTNKRITRRVSAVSAPGATPSMNTDNFDVFNFTGLAANITSMTSGLTGTPVDGDVLRISFTDNGTARTIAWGASFESSTVTLPTTTVISARLDCGFFWNSASGKWRIVASA